MIDVEQIEAGLMKNFVYIISSTMSDDAIIVDPGLEPQIIYDTIKAKKLNLSKIILTHEHFDHVDGTQYLKSRTGAKVLAHIETASALRGSIDIDNTIDEGDKIMLENESEEILVLHTPGHTKGSICLLVANKWLITGDTLFIGNCGRTDLPGGSMHQMFESLQKIKKLPPHLIILPGHNYAYKKQATLQEELKSNPVLMTDSYEIFNSIP